MRPSPLAEPLTLSPSAPTLLDLLQFDTATAKPLYQQLSDRLIGLIGDGTISPGTTLPAERQLADSLRVSRATVQRAYSLLRDRKLLSAQGRLGSIVQSGGSRLHPGMDRLKGFTDEMRELGRVASSRILERAVVSDRSIASLFNQPSHARFLKLVRIRMGDDIPMSREVAWYSLEAAPALATADLSHSVYALLRDMGAPLAFCEQTIEAAVPTAEERAIFAFREAVPCLLIKRRSFGLDGGMIEYVEGLFRGDAYAYKLTLRA